VDGFAVLPAAITMVAGPQIISAVVLATSGDPRRNSLAFLVGVASAVVFGTLVALGLVETLDLAARQAGGPGSERWIRYLLAGLLVVLAVRAFDTRRTAQTPRWLTGLQTAQPHTALRLGFLLFLAMPTDVVMMLSAAGYLAKNDLGVLHSLPFILATLLLASLPFLAYLLLGKRAETVLPAVRDWMTRDAWAINIAVYLYFIYSLLK
jgi:threonine/homoserine/homoserine lactone efflux protein